MDLSASKKELLKLILEIENKDLIQRITDYIRNDESDFWNDLSETQKKQIKQGIEELDQNEKIEFDELIKRIT